MKARAKATEPGRRPKPVPLAQPRGELAGQLTVSYPKTRVPDLALPEVLGARLDRVLTEQRERDRLHEHGFSPLRELLLVGPPGTGKTMTAAALAGELDLPLSSIRLDRLISKYLGETASCRPHRPGASSSAARGARARGRPHLEVRAVAGGRMVRSGRLEG